MSLVNNLFRIINLISLMTSKRYLSINRYYLNDSFWAFKKNFIGQSTVHDRMYRLLEAYNFSSINVLQIGAHNGSDNNVLSVRALATLKDTKIVLVEPNPVVFEELSSNYSSYPNVTCLNIAISLKSGEQDFYTVTADESLPAWANQLSSFDKDQILKASVEFPNITDYIVNTRVVCETYNNVVDSCLDGRANVVLIDVEGFDADIVCSMNLQSDRPEIIYFEHQCLSGQKIKESIDFLSRHGYKFTHAEYDTLAYKCDLPLL